MQKGGVGMRDDRKYKKSNQVNEQPMTYEDYAALDDGHRYELAGGILEFMSPAPSVLHQVISFELQKRIADTCEAEYMILYAPVDLILSETEIRQPDLVLIHRSRLHILSKRGIEGPPDIVLEIISPSTLKRDKVEKWKTYAEYRIPEYWMIDASTGVLEQFEWKDGHYEAADVYTGEEPVRSSRVTCLNFSMKDIMEKIQELPESVRNP